ncbi:MAG: hypothetical protein M1838_006192 [Thelocarpon superellum]|nr:MAG: hypothetical protein M1838_006192 [Thelocarpon superellum]
MAATKLSPLDWNIRFKRGKLTILLDLDCNRPLATVKAEVLKALHARYPSGQLDGITIPTEPADIIFGKPVDSKDLSQGWTTLEAVDLNGDGKAGKSRAAAKVNGLDSLQGAGVKDKSFVAFRFKGETEARAAASDELADEAEPFDVVIPTYDDEYDETA